MLDEASIIETAQRKGYSVQRFVGRHSCLILINGDSKELLPLVCDAIVTDPPYGISADRKQGHRAGKQHGQAVAPSRDYGPVTEWDAAPADSDFLRSLIFPLRNRCPARRAVVYDSALPFRLNSLRRLT